MPFYEIHTTHLLPTPLRSRLANLITTEHATRFSAPKLFVNIRFTHHDPLTTPALYVGGTPRRTNYIIAHIRPSAQRTRSSLDALCARIAEIWNQEVESVLKAENGGEVKRDAEGVVLERGLHAVFVLPDIGAGWEQGLVIPVAGEDGVWLEEVWGEIEGRAEGKGVGDEGSAVWRECVEDVKGRGLVGGGKEVA